MANYEIKFPQGCGEFKQGDIVPEVLLGDVDYLLRVGAVELSKKEESYGNTQRTSAKTNELKEQVAELKADIEMHKATNDDLLKSKTEAEAKVLELDNKVKELTEEVKDLKKKLKDATK